MPHDGSEVDEVDQVFQSVLSGSIPRPFRSLFPFVSPRFAPVTARFGPVDALSVASGRQSYQSFARNFSRIESPYVSERSQGFSLPLETLTERPVEGLQAAQEPETRRRRLMTLLMEYGASDLQRC